MKHYAFLIPQVFQQEWSGMEFSDDGTRDVMVSLYSASVPDAAADFALSEYVSTLVFAHQVLAPVEAQFNFAVVLESDGLAPFTATAPAHLFFDKSRTFTNQFSRLMGLIPDTLGDHHLGLLVGQNRAEGRVTQHYYGRCVQFQDLVDARRLKYNSGRALLLTDGPLAQFWFPWHQWSMANLPYLDSLANFDRDGNRSIFFQKESWPELCHVTQLRDRSRRMARRNEWERGAESLVESLVWYMADVLAWYDDGFLRFNHQWGDGFTPHNGLMLEYTEMVVNQWQLLAQWLGYTVPETFLIDTKGNTFTYPEVPATTAASVTVTHNMATVGDCIQRLYALGQWWETTLRWKPWRDNAGAHYTLAGSIRGTEAYNNWDDLEQWIFQTANTVCVLFSVFNLKISRRKSGNHHHGQSYHPNIGGAGGGQGHRDFNTDFPQWQEVLPWDKDPFLQFYDYPAAAGAINLVPPAPPPIPIHHHPELWDLMDRLDHINWAPSKDQICEVLFYIKEAMDAVDFPKWLVEKLLDWLFYKLGISWHTDWLLVDTKTGKWKLDWKAIAFEYACSGTQWV